METFYLLEMGVDMRASEEGCDVTGVRESSLLELNQGSEPWLPIPQTTVLPAEESQM